MGSKSGQPQQQQKSGYSGGKSGQPQNRNPGFQMGGKQNKSGWQPQSPNYGKSGQMQPMQQQGDNRWNQGYANLTANPNPSMPPQVGAPQTGAFPYPQQPQAQPQQQGQDPTQAAPAQPQAAQPMSVAPNSKSMWQPTQEFYDAVTKTLGEKKMATQGQYDQGWNKEVGGDSRARGREDAKRMEQALGRPLTRQEVSQLEQRQTGWRFVPPGIDFATGKPHGPALKPEDYWKGVSPEDQQAQFGLAAPR